MFAVSTNPKPRLRPGDNVLSVSRGLRALLVSLIAILLIESRGLGDETNSIEPGNATILLHCRWSRPANRTIEIQFDGGVRLASLFQPTETPASGLTEEQLDSSGRIRLQTDNPATSFLIELKCEVSGSGTLTTRIREGDQDLGENRIRFEDLLRQRTELKLPGDSGTLAIWRKPGDELQIQVSRPHFIYSESEIFQGIATFNFGAPPDRRSHPALQWSLRENRSNRLIRSGTTPIVIPRRNNAPMVQQGLALHVPDVEGAYDLHVALVNDSGVQLGYSIIPLVVHPGKATETASRIDSNKRRLAMAVHRPFDLLDSMDDRAVDLDGNRTLTDWTSMLRLTHQLSSEVEQNGLNTLLLGINVDGAALYPTNSVNQNMVRFDNGRCSPLAPDPIKKDVVELLFREFDLRNLTLIPEIDLTDIDPALERLATGSMDTDSKHAEGNIRIDAPSGPHYNILNPLVQNRVLEIIQEIVERYGHHESFGGISVSLHDGSWICYSGWRISENETARRLPFRASKISLVVNEEEDSRSPLAQNGNSQQETEVIAERCRRMANLYQRMTQAISKSHAGAKLYISPHRLVSSERFQREVLNALHSGRSLDSLLAIRGIEPRLLQDEERIVLLRPYCSLNADLARGNPGIAGSQQMVVTGINASPVFNQSTPPWRGSLNIPLFNSPHRTQRKDHQILDRFLSHTLSDLDFGSLFIDSETLPDESEPTETTELIQNLPNLMFEVLPNVRQPIVVRRAQTADKTWLYAVNESSLPAEVSFSTNTLEPFSIRPLTPLSLVEVTRTNQVQTWKWDLEPRSAKGCVIDLPKLDIARVETVVDTAALEELQRKVNGLEVTVNRTDLHADSAQLLLPNADFESVTTAETLPPGWNYLHSPDLPPTLDSSVSHSGISSLMLERQLASQPVGITTFPLAIDRIKHLTISFWGRSSSSDLSLTLRLSGKNGADEWKQEAVVHPERNWQQFVFRIPNLPEDLNDAQFSVLLNAPGKVWVDDFAMFPQPLAPEDERRLMRAIASIRLAWQEERYADCARLMDGYWGRFLRNPPPVSVNGDRQLPQIGSRYREMIVR